MKLDELKRDLKAILSIEEQDEIDWSASEAMCLKIIERLATGPEPDYPYDIVYHFLDDPDVRQKDARYAHRQQERLREWLA